MTVVGAGAVAPLVSLLPLPSAVRCRFGERASGWGARAATASAWS